MELFENSGSATQPLAAKMRPRTIDEYIGQDHIVGEGRLLRRLIQADRISSLLFYGPPGTGKTTLASVIAHTTSSRFVILNAVLSGVKQLREELEEAAGQQKLYGRRTILFVDEVHRWNKSQQDALLPWVEDGTIVLIGATTENPYFEVNPALVSRSRIFRLKKLDNAGMLAVMNQALQDKERGYGCYRVKVSSDASDHLIKTADGDARNLLNALELAVETTPDTFPPPDGSLIEVNLQIAEDSIQQKAVLYDKEGDYHYDIISAFIKSIRGSDPDAVLYWLARMIHAGEDPRFIFRRMLISACEDIGLADPNALQVVESAAAAFDRVGLPEGRFMLSQAAVYLACAEKSNSNLGLFDAIASVSQEQSSEVPNHLKDAGRDSKGFGHGKGYLYPHAFRNHWTAQQYLPDGLQGRIFYHPSSQGYEAGIRDHVLRRRELQLEQAVSHADEERYTWSPDNNRQSEWLRRAGDRAQATAELRDSLLELGDIKRHHNLLVVEEGSALLYWEALRRAPEGGVYLLSDREEVGDHVRHYFSENEIDDIPLVVEGSRSNLTPLSVLVGKNRGLKFNAIMGRNLLSGVDLPIELLLRFKEFLSEGGLLLFSQRDFSASTRLSTILEEASDELAAAVTAAEVAMLGEDPLYSWSEARVQALCRDAGLSLVRSFSVERKREVQVDPALVDQWLDPALPGYGSRLNGHRDEILRLVNHKRLYWSTVDNCFSLSILQ